MKLTPFLNRIVVKKINEAAENEEKIGSLYIPKVAQENQLKEQRAATVEAVSEQSSKYFHIGQTVFIGKYSGIEVKENGIDYLIVKIEDVHGYLKND